MFINKITTFTALTALTLSLAESALAQSLHINSKERYHPGNLLYDRGQEMVVDLEGTSENSLTIMHEDMEQAPEPAPAEDTERSKTYLATLTACKLALNTPNLRPSVIHALDDINSATEDGKARLQAIEQQVLADYPDEPWCKLVMVFTYIIANPQQARDLYNHSDHYAFWQLDEQGARLQRRRLGPEVLVPILIVAAANLYMSDQMVGMYQQPQSGVLIDAPRQVCSAVFNEDALARSDQRREEIEALLNQDANCVLSFNYSASNSHVGDVGLQDRDACALTENRLWLTQDNPVFLSLMDMFAGLVDDAHAAGATELANWIAELTAPYLPDHDAAAGRGHAVATGVVYLLLDAVRLRAKALCGEHTHLRRHIFSQVDLQKTALDALHARDHASDGNLPMCTIPRPPSELEPLSEGEHAAAARSCPIDDDAGPKQAGPHRNLENEAEEDDRKPAATESPQPPTTCTLTFRVGSGLGQWLTRQLRAVTRIASRFGYDSYAREFASQLDAMQHHPEGHYSVHEFLAYVRQWRRVAMSEGVYVGPAPDSFHRVIAILNKRIRQEPLPALDADPHVPWEDAVWPIDGTVFTTTNHDGIEGVGPWAVAAFLMGQSSFTCLVSPEEARDVLALADLEAAMAIPFRQSSAMTLDDAASRFSRGMGFTNGMVPIVQRVSETSQSHMFLLVRLNGVTYIFDPSDPAARLVPYFYGSVAHVEGANRYYMMWRDR